jgi:hypothetical protein
LLTGAGVRVYDVKQICLASRAGNDDKGSKEKKAFGPILNLHFLLGWRLRHQAKSVTSNLPILSVLGAGALLKLSQLQQFIF